MEFVVGFALVLAAVVGLLWLVDRRNPGRSGGRDIHAEDQLESRTSWGPR